MAKVIGSSDRRGKVLASIGMVVLLASLQGVVFGADASVVYGVNRLNGAILWHSEISFPCDIRVLARRIMIFKVTAVADNGQTLLPPIDGRLFDIDSQSGRLSRRQSSPDERREYEDSQQAERLRQKRFGEVISSDDSPLHLHRTFGVNDKIEFRTDTNALHWLIQLGGELGSDRPVRGDGVRVFVAIERNSGSKVCAPHIRCYAPKTRAELWNTHVSGGGAIDCKVAFELLQDELFAMSAQTVSCLAADTGRKKWSVKLTASGVDSEPQFFGFAWSTNNADYLRPTFIVVGETLIVVWSEGIAGLNHKTGKQQWIRLVKDNKPFTIKSAGVKGDVVLLTVDGTEPKELFVKLKTAKDATEK